MLSWPYAQLVVDAQNAGGPDLYRRNLFEIGYNAGKQDMLLWIGIAAAGGALTVALYNSVLGMLRERRAERRKIVEKKAVTESVLERIKCRKQQIIVNISS